MRIFITIVLPLFLPTLIYVLWLVTVGRAQPAGAGMWRDLPWAWLAAAGVALAAVLLYLVSVHVERTGSGSYVPPRYIDGKIVPGHVEPVAPAER